MKPILTEETFLSSYKLQKFGEYALDRLKIKFPIYPSPNLAKIVSYITFDGHLSLDKNLFYLSSGNVKGLKEFENLVRNTFRANGKIIKTEGNDFGVSYKFLVLNKPICRILKLIGTPVGSKVNSIFDVPFWIVNNRENSKAYLNVAFKCEGSIWKEKSHFKVRFKIHKSERLLENGLIFMNTLRKMLLIHGIKTSKIWLIRGNITKRGITKGICFNILSKDIPILNNKIWGCHDVGLRKENEVVG